MWRWPQREAEMAVDIGSGLRLRPVARGDADGVVALARQQFEPHQVAKRVGQGQDLGRQSAFGLADRLALSPPFAPWP